jgi:hypothetical protein
MIVTLQASRIARLVASEVESGRMTIGEAITTAQLAFKLDADEVDYVRERLEAEYQER